MLPRSHQTCLHVWLLEYSTSLQLSSEKFIKIQSRCNCVLGHPTILSPFIFYIRPFRSRFFHKFTIDNMLRNIRTIHNSIPNTTINWLNENFHSDFSKLIIQPTKHQRTIDWGSPNKRKFVLSYKDQNLNNCQELTLDTYWKHYRLSSRGDVNWTFKIFANT